jgi:polysaccharide deacetylase 2 family uncharacterized protein YibQ
LLKKSFFIALTGFAVGLGVITALIFVTPDIDPVGPVTQAADGSAPSPGTAAVRQRLVLAPKAPEVAAAPPAPASEALTPPASKVPAPEFQTARTPPPPPPPAPPVLHAGPAMPALKRPEITVARLAPLGAPEPAVDGAAARRWEQMEHDNVQLASLTPPAPLPAAPQAQTPPQPPPNSASTAAMGAVAARGAPPSPAAVSRAPAWQRYAAPAPAIEGRDRVAIVLDDMGLSQSRSDRAIALPRPVTLAILPYGNHLHGLVARARTAGHEVMLHLPMEPNSAAADPGPDALLTGLPVAELDRRIAANLARMEGYVGVNNHMGSRFTASGRAMRRVMRALRGRQLLFLDSLTTARSTGYRLARKFGIPVVVRDIFLDNDRDPEQIRRQLALTAARARAFGQAVAIGHPYPETLDALESWLPGLADQGLVLVPISTLVTLRDGAPALETSRPGAAATPTPPAQLGLANSRPAGRRATP